MEYGISFVKICVLGFFPLLFLKRIFLDIFSKKVILFYASVLFWVGTGQRLSL